MTAAMSTLRQIFMMLSLFCFLLAALGIAWTRGNLLGAGLFFLTLALEVT